MLKLFSPFVWGFYIFVVPTLVSNPVLSIGQRLAGGNLFKAMFASAYLFLFATVIFTCYMYNEEKYSTIEFHTSKNKLMVFKHT